MNINIYIYTGGTAGMRWLSNGLAPRKFCTGVCVGRVSVLVCLSSLLCVCLLCCLSSSIRPHARVA